jgi:peptidoglycan hydrolase-like protein with peptidoglycan-binding domain
MKKYLVITFLVVLTSISLANADIVRTLKLGSTGSDVRELQVLLNKDPETRVTTTGAGSPGNETQYFGSLTKAAVLKFQTKYANEVLYPIGLSFATGVVGPQTRAKINKLFSSNGSDPIIPLPPVKVDAPYISNISPVTITSSPQMITISGNGFTVYGNNIIIASDSDKGIGYYNSPDGKTITFPFVSKIAEKIKTQLASYKSASNYQTILNAFVSNLTGETVFVEDGVTYVHAIILVKNSGGASNSFDVKVNIKSLLQ